MKDSFNRISIPIMYEMFAKTVVQLGYPAPVREYQFAPPRKWRIDFAWPEYKLAIEAEGGIFMRKDGIRGGHVRGAGYKNNMHKYNEIELAGYTLLRFMPEELMAYGIDTIERFFKEKKKSGNKKNRKPKHKEIGAINNYYPDGSFRIRPKKGF